MKPEDPRVLGGAVKSAEVLKRSPSVCPTPTVILPTCDRPHTLVRSAMSALKALPPNGELIVVDDGLEHDAAASLGEFRDPRLKILRSPGRQGPSAARNLGARHANGDVLFFVDDDDVLVADYVVRILDGIATGRIRGHFGFSAVRVGARVSGGSRSSGPFGESDPLGLRISGLGMGFWISRSKFEAAGGLDESLGINEDTEFCLRLASQGENGWYESEPGVVIRPESDQRGSARFASVTSRHCRHDRARIFERLLVDYGGLFSKHAKERRRFALRAVKYSSPRTDLRSSFRKGMFLMPGENRVLVFLMVACLSVLERIRTKMATRFGGIA